VLNQSFAEVNTLTDTQSGSIYEFSSTIQEISLKAQQLAQFAEEILYDKEKNKEKY
jgi:methyl-accepting chemotaxis protein